MTGIDSTDAGTCFPENGTTMVDNSLAIQSPGFTIEPYCGSVSRLTNEQVIGEYDVTDAPEYTVALGVNPAYNGWRSVQIFAIDPVINPPASTTTTKAAQPTTSTATRNTSSVPGWAYATVVVLLVVGLAIGYIVVRPSVSKQQD